MCHEEGQRSEMKMKLVGFQLLSSSSVAVSTSQDFDDNATITAFWEEKEQGGSEGRSTEHLDTASFYVAHAKRWRESLTFSKPMAQSLSILRVYSGLETGAPA